MKFSKEPIVRHVLRYVLRKIAVQMILKNSALLSAQTEDCIANQDLGTIRFKMKYKTSDSEVIAEEIASACLSLAMIPFDNEDNLRESTKTIILNLVKKYPFSAYARFIAVRSLNGVGLIEDAQHHMIVLLCMCPKDPLVHKLAVHLIKHDEEKLLIDSLLEDGWAKFIKNKDYRGSMPREKYLNILHKVE